jgi:aspartyl-tRNA(Asn)/glutamyl-tRNA(Gln) amidotransferase subunit B
MKRFEAVIGLEVHAQLKTSSKMFCACNAAFGAPPNTSVCPVCLGLPGALPATNKRAVELALRVGLAAGCRIPQVSVFARKNYFYPDLPKGYQISQYDHPLCEGGEISVSMNEISKHVGLIRIHLEEDAGKSLHAQDAGGDFSLVDFNRSGVPLIEIVTKPELTAPREAVACLGSLKQLMEYLEVSDCDMEKGSLRCDVNVSVRPSGTASMGVKTEIKNLNSFRNLEKALAFEIERHIGVLSRGEEVAGKTLLWDESRGACAPMRSKEEAHDYRYFPEPDLPPIVISQGLLAKVKAGLPELPWDRKGRFRGEYKIPSYDADLLTSTRAMADYYEACVKVGAEPKAASNWIMTEVLRALRERGESPERFPVGPSRLARLLALIRDGTISGRAAKEIFEEMIESGEEPSAIVKRRGLGQIRDRKAIDAVVAEVLDRECRAVEQYMKGKEAAVQFLVGKVMEATRGRADPRLVQEAVRESLGRMKGRA